MSEHTPGPWRINRSERMLSQWGVGKDLYVGMVVADTPVAAITHSGLHFDEAQCNARLIAAAPELLEALQEFAAHHACGCGHPYCKNCERDQFARAAIAKALGEG